MISEVFAAESVKIVMFFDKTLHDWRGGYWRFEGNILFRNVVNDSLHVVAICKTTKHKRGEMRVWREAIGHNVLCDGNLHQ
jgi:hypothetical protein